MEETRTTGYFYYYVQEDDCSKPIPSFVSNVVDARKELSRKRSKSSDKQPLNWFRKLSSFKSDFFLAAAGLFLPKNYSKGA